MPAARLAAPPAILDHLSSLADPTRSRILLLLDRQELTVTELCVIMQLPQSTVSRHLKALADSGWVAARAEGTSNLYSATRDDLDPAARRLWALVRELRQARRPRCRISVALPRRSPSGERSRRNFSPRLPVNGIGCATNCLAIAFTSQLSQRLPRAAGRSAIWAAARGR